MGAKRLLPLLAFWLVCLWPGGAAAFCGFFVSGASDPLVNDATQVALLREGLRTVLTMRNSYKGPPEDFALVIPVPVVLQKSQVRTLPPQVFEHLDLLTAPRLVEYWEQDPCWREQYNTVDDKEGGTGVRAKAEEGSMGGARPAVRVEAEFAVDEYDVVILSADDSLALSAWLRENRYSMPAGVEPYLRPYVQAGSKFFVAKVDAARVKFLWGRAVLSPLRFHYDSEAFSLPIRLGLANADGPQDLVIYVLARGQRYEVANYDNLFIPTNLEVRDDVRRIFPSFYATLFDRTVAGKPRAVVTEYSWDAASCDPCPTPPLDNETVAQLGADALPGGVGRGFVLTRLHARYSRETLGEDFVFRSAGPASGGREDSFRGGKNSRGAGPASANAFQGRYIIRHPWDGPIDCAEPQFGEWGGPPSGSRPPPSAGMTSLLRRDAPLDALILDAAPTAEGTAPRAAARAERSHLELFWILIERNIGRAPWAPFAALGAGLLAVAIAARRARTGVLRHAAMLLALGVLPLTLLVFANGKESVLEAPHGYALLALIELCAAALVIAASAAQSKPPRYVWEWALAALAPLAVALLDHRQTLRLTGSIARSEADDSSVYVRILAQGESEALQAIALGAAGSAVLLAFAALALAARSGEVAPRRTLANRALTISFVWGIVAIVALAPPFGWRSAQWPLFVCLLVVVAGGASAALLAHRSAPRDARARAARPATLGQTAWLLALAAFCAVAASAARYRSQDLGSLAGESVDGQQAFRLLTRVLDEAASFTWKAPLLMLAVLAPLVPLWLTARQPVRATLHEPGGAAQNASPWRATALLAALTSLAGVLMGLLFRTSQNEIAALHLPLSGPDRFAQVQAIEPPELPGDWPDEPAQARSFAGPALFVDAHGTLLGSASMRRSPEPFGEAMFRTMSGPPEDLEAEPEPLLVADARLTTQHLIATLTPLLARRQTSFRWVMGDRPAPARANQLGVYSDLLQRGPHRRTTLVEILRRVEVLPREPGEAAPRGQRLALLVRLAPARWTLQRLSGRLGHYRSLPGVRPFVIDNPTGNESALRDPLDRVSEIVLQVPEGLEVGQMNSALVKLLRWMVPAPRATPVFVITTDPAAAPIEAP